MPEPPFWRSIRKATKNIYGSLSRTPRLTPNRVLIVNITSPAAWKESVCIIRRGEHGWITHDSFVNYADSKIAPLALLNEGKDKGLFKLLEPVSFDVLKRIRDAALSSTRMPLENADLLIEQGLVV